MTPFIPLEKALESWFDKFLFELPPSLKRRVTASLPIAALWDDLPSEQRRAVARYQDFLHDPQLFDFNEFWFNFYARNRELEHELADWQRTATPTASDMQLRQGNIARLEQELVQRQHLEKALLYRRFPHHERSGDDNDYPAIDDRTAWIAFPKALRILETAFDATAEEVAAWIFMGAGRGGLRAWEDQPRVPEPKRFYYEPEQNNDYVTPLIRCWFIEQEILAFCPTERFITGRQLTEKWAPVLNERTARLIEELTAAGRLTDLHPVQGGTRVSTGYADGPELSTGLFAASEIASVEAEELAVYFQSASHEDKQRMSAKRKEEIHAIFNEEVEQRGKRGALQRTANRLELHRTTVSAILKR
jgi:hypothetical protein